MPASCAVCTLPAEPGAEPFCARHVGLPGSAQSAPAPAPTGRKDDAKKARWNLVPWDALAAVVRVLGAGADRYGVDNWKLVPDHRTRYFAATMRHVTAWWGGELRDPDTGEHHLAHAICCCLFLIAMEPKS